MKRLHVHVGVEDLTKSVAYYSALFGEEPVKSEQDYAKWLLEDPRVNFSISTNADCVGAAEPGIQHLGIETQSASELDEVRSRVALANSYVSSEVVNQEDVQCCYALGDKSWTTDPDGVSWESFFTKDSVSGYFGEISQSDIDRSYNGPTPCC